MSGDAADRNLSRGCSLHLGDNDPSVTRLVTIALMPFSFAAPRQLTSEMIGALTVKSRVIAERSTWKYQRNVLVRHLHVDRWKVLSNDGVIICPVNGCSTRYHDLFKLWVAL